MVVFSPLNSGVPLSLSCMKLAQLKLPRAISVRVDGSG